MKINKYINDYAFNEELSVRSALQQIESTNLKTLFVIDNLGHLKGVLVDGDIRRWLLNSLDHDLELPVKNILPAQCVSASINLPPTEIKELFSSKVRTIPLIDEDGLLIAVAESKDTKIKVGTKNISTEDEVFIIAEIGNNHQGNLQMAKELIDSCIDANVDCIKFQMRTMSSLYDNKGDSSDVSADLGDQYTLDLLSKFQLSDEDLFKAFDYCREKGGIPLCTPWDLESLVKLEEYGMPAYKIASADFTNYELLDAAAKTYKPLFCSTGMSTEQEIIKSSQFLKNLGSQCIFLHCNSTYPTPFKDINLSYIPHLKDITNSLVGYSGHERGINIPLAAVSLGAKVIEKHITLDKSLEGNDHKVSLTPDEFVMLVKNIRQIEESMGQKGPREISQGELLNREVLAKSLIANTEIKKGEIIERDMISVKSPGKGLQPNRIDDLVGKITHKDFKKGDLFYNSDIKTTIQKKQEYNFQRPYGIPVRYHDFKDLAAPLNLDFVEFHLSYQDLNEEPADFIDPDTNLDFSVHTPELFENDHILDLCSFDDEYRKISIDNMKRVIEHVEALRPIFRSKKLPVLIINAGGWNKDGFISSNDKKLKYEILEDSLNQIDLSGVDLGIQTMPPFPWHFGGQSFHNLFVDPEEIDAFCSKNNYKICLDISHSAMACHHYGWDLIKFTKKISSHINYLHIVDAKGSDGEGVEIGKGDVDFKLLCKTLNENNHDIPFIPEVWQGHKDQGIGFYNALNFLEKYL
ncbi:MAG: acetylneuraminic acid synthetase [Rickettsiales bacterium TMED289]|nr:MAG: acetylneuraminic acid synthetase [Rickettsiales bacterium TMED289]|tara:strand:- start:82 stop:2328 length:2247 start_codon:yes stop_codon:yes gene_type:complete